MALRPQRSLRHEYELYVDEEIENYKESIPRSALLSVGDEAVSRLGAGPQILLTELLLCDEVNRIIFKRLRLPSYDTWRRKRLKLAKELRRPEHWGLTADHVAVRAIAQAAEGRVLVAGMTEEDGSALFLAANGCQVTAVHREARTVERVMHAANEAGLAERVRAVAADLSAWEPEEPLTAVICTPTALAGLNMKARRRVIEVLQSATADGGVHLVQMIAAGGRRTSPSLDELRSRYRGWSVTVDEDRGDTGLNTFVARKEIA
ncbi:MAG: SAM-dependent methyltransferase [Gemmatimonadaceae bacterium]